jgi:hypothetical protein
MSGDTVDMSGLPGLPCGTITLTVGEIYVNQVNLTIKGPGASSLSIDGTQLPGGATYLNNSRIFTHTQAGDLKIQDVTLTGGHVYHNGNGLDYRGIGGCVSSQGNVTLTNVDVTSCSATVGGSNAVFGGGVYAKGSLTLNSSTLSGNSVFGGGTATGGGAHAGGVMTLNHSTVTGNHAVGGGETLGGGLYAKDNLIVKFSRVAGNYARSNGSSARGGGGRSGATLAAKYSTIDGNSVFGNIGVTDTSFKYALGGGLSAGTNAYIRQSTISNNYSNGSSGGIDALGGLFDAATNGVEMYSSTISGNHAEKLVGGMYTNAGTVKLINSTIAFNTAGVSRTGASFPFTYWGAGLALSGEATAMTVTMQSSLLSNNYTTGEFDLTTGLTSVNTITFSGTSANNLSRVTALSSAGTGTVGYPGALAGCPLLGTLRDNGGPTWTHALLSTSAAINAGSNTLAYIQDQRGLSTDMAPFAYPRVSNGAADIGAYEVNHDDIVFNGGFEGCSVLE